MNTEILSRRGARINFFNHIFYEDLMTVFSSRTTKLLCLVLVTQIGLLLMLRLGSYLAWPITHRYGGGHDRDIRGELMTAFPDWFRHGTPDYPGNFKFYAGEGWESDFPSIHLCDELIVYGVPPQLRDQDAVLQKLKELREKYRAKPIRVEFHAYSPVEKWTDPDGGKVIARMEGVTVRTAWIY